ncbi:MAG: ArsA family ATPase [Bacillota bacterium]|nr:ArsA family ATPase [Bacillota bacterium]
MKSIDSLLYPRPGQCKQIFFAGKGGVGKTSLACITAVHTALKGYRTLLLTTDPAAHIGSVLDRPVTEIPTEISGVPNLYAAKIDQKKAFEEYRSSVLNDARERFDESTVKAMEEEMNSPCTEEMAVFQKFISYASSVEYDVMVFDTAPTGHTLRLLELPMDWSKQLQLMAGEKAEISENDRAQKERFDRVIRQMRDDETTTFCFVMYPEKTPIIEAWRASEELKTAGIHTRLVAANLIIPEEAAVSPFYRKRREMQMRYLKEICERFPEAAILEVPMYEKEIRGIGMLKSIAVKLFGI